MFQVDKGTGMEATFLWGSNTLVDKALTRILSCFLGNNSLLYKSNLHSALEQDNIDQLGREVVLLILEDKNVQLGISLHSLSLFHHNKDKSCYNQMHCILLYYHQ